MGLADVQERLLPVPYQWIVLNLFSTDAQFDSVGGIPQVPDAVEGNGTLLICFQLVLHIGTPMG